MTKFLKISAIAAMLLGLWSCGGNDSPADDEAAGRMEINIVVKSSSNPKSRRPLESSDAYQGITDMKIYLFRAAGPEAPADNSGYTYYMPERRGVKVPYISITSFNKTGIWNDAVQGNEVHRYTSDGWRLSDGYFKYVAIARDDVSPASMAGSLIDDAAFEASLVEGVTTLSSLSMALADPSSSVSPEIFYGVNYDAPTMVIDNRKIIAHIELTRIVAGALLYVDNVPATVKMGSSDTPVGGVALLQLIRSTDFTLAVPSLAVSAAEVLTPPAAGGSLAYVIAKCDIPSGAVTEGGVYLAIDPKATDAHPNATRAGAFISPMTSPGATAHTFLLAIYGRDNRILKTYEVRMADNIAGKPVKAFDIISNHIYCLGAYDETNGTDEPIDLTKVDGDIIIAVGNWQDDVTVNF